MISSYFGSDICTICGNKCKSIGSSRSVVCPSCKTDTIKVTCIAVERLNNAQRKANRLASVCAACNGCPESSSTFAAEEFSRSKSKKTLPSGLTSAHSRIVGRICNPIANCVCIDCPVTYKRHEVRESEIEATELMSII